MKKPVKAIIPAAGLGTRLLPATKSQPKEMLPVGRKPILQYVVEELVQANLNQILLITGRRKRAIEDHFDRDPDLRAALKSRDREAPLIESNFSSEKVRFFYTRQGVQKGLGHAVLLGKEFIDDENFVVALGDSIISAPKPESLLLAMIRAQENLNAAAVVAVETVPRQETHRYGIVAVKGKYQAGEPVLMSDIIEKPDRGSAPSDLAVAARYIFNPEIFNSLHETESDAGGEIQLTDAIRRLIRKGLPVYAWPMRPDERRYDIGNFESYFKTFIDFCLHDPQHGETMRKFLKEKNL